MIQTGAIMRFLADLGDEVERLIDKYADTPLQHHLPITVSVEDIDGPLAKLMEEGLEFDLTDDNNMS